MFKDRREPLLLVAAATELPSAQRVWGTGGWLPPEQREALDWLTLARFLGWRVVVSRQTGTGFDADLDSGSCWIILACDPDCLPEDLVVWLASRLAAEPLLVVARAPASHGALARLAGVTRRSEQVMGRSLSWRGPGPECHWYCRRELEASILEVSENTGVWATLNGAPLMTARRVGRGVIATLGLHPSYARDVDGAATALLKHLLIWGSAAPVAWLDFDGSLVLRMDDPGGAQNIHSRDWAYPKLGEAQWAAIGTDLQRRQARLSIGYVAGWVDDGDAARGVLLVAGRQARRIPGQVYPSPLVQYQDLAGHAPGTLCDYQAEFRGIQSLRTAGVGDVEIHGYTHMHPNRDAWAQAPDRYETWPATAWYRELGRAAEAAIAARPLDQHPLALGVTALHRYFAIHPTTLICPGDQWTDAVLERALDLGCS